MITAQEQAVLDEYLRRRVLKQTGKSFLDFAMHTAPYIVFEEFHVLIAEKFQQLLEGVITRLMIFAPPRAGKSLFTSELLPQWWIGNHPEDQILHTSYATTLVEGFGRKIRNTLSSSDEFKELYPQCRLSSDSKSATRWNTTKNGVYNAAGVGTGIAGKGWHLGLVDDPISEQDAFSRTLRNNVNAWYGPGFYTRRMPDRNAVVLTQTRWAPDDLSGFLLANAVINPEADQFDVLKISAEIDQDMADELNRVANDPRYEKYLNPPGSKHPYPMYYSAGGSFSPRRWPLHALAQSRGNMTRKNWAALYQQSPTEDGGAVFLREYWKKWTAKQMPKFEYIFQMYDTAFEEKETNDFSVRITFGVFRRESDNRYCVMILEWYKDRVSFPKLKEEAFRSYQEYRPDRVGVEKAASGIPLLQELRKAGIPVAPITPKGSKLTRAHAATILFEQGCVYYPDRRWAEELIDVLAGFTGKNDTHDDDADVISHALTFLRRMFWIDTPDDYEDPEDMLSSDFDVPRRSYARVHGSYAKG